MILELVEFNAPKDATREQVAADARSVFAKWQANKELVSKSFVLELNGKGCGGVYIWPTVEAAQRAHNEEWRQSVIKRAGAAPIIRYFDLMATVDNAHGEVKEFPEAPEMTKQPAA